MGKRRVGVIVAHLLILPFFLIACSSTPDKKVGPPELAREKYKEAIKYAKLNMRKEMYENLHAAVELDPEEGLYHLELGSAYFVDNKLDEAEKELLLTLKLNSSFIETYYRLGRLYMVRQKWDSALYYFREVMNRPGLANPHQVHNWIAISYYAKGDINSAEKAWREALEIKENSQIRLNLALAYKANGRYDLAIKSLKIAVETDPFLVGAHYELAQLYLKGKDLNLALKHFQQVIDLEPLSDLGKNSQEYINLINSGKKTS